VWLSASVNCTERVLARLSSAEQAVDGSFSDNAVHFTYRNDRSCEAAHTLSQRRISFLYAK